MSQKQTIKCAECGISTTISHRGLCFNCILTKRQNEAKAYSQTPERKAKAKAYRDTPEAKAKKKAKYEENHSEAGDIILDPFLGSGTTAVACEKLQRRWIGIEISKEYYEIAKKQIEPWINQTRINAFGQSE